MRARGGAAACILASAAILAPTIAAAQGAPAALLLDPDVILWIAGFVSLGLVAFEAGLVMRTSLAARGAAFSPAMGSLRDHASHAVRPQRIDSDHVHEADTPHEPHGAPIAPHLRDVVEVTGLLARVARRNSRARLSLPAEPQKLYSFASDAALERALEILIDNALTNGQRAAISCDHGTSHLTVHVDDDGPGVPRSARSHIFNWHFYMSTPASQQIGCGVELVIAQQIVRAHGGSLAVSASPLGGARFTMRLLLIGPHKLELVGGS